MEKIRLYETDKDLVKKIQKGLVKKDLNILYYLVFNNIVVSRSIYTKDYNEEYIKQHNLKTIDLPREGGTIVAFPKDIHIVYFVEEATFSGIPEEIIKLRKYFISRPETSKVQGNDFLVDGYKVASFSVKRLEPNDKVLFVNIIFDYDIDAEIIKHVCKKEMIKVPKGLKDFNVPYEDILNIVNL